MAQLLDPSRLPDQTRPRIQLLVERSAPDPTRTRLPPEIEERLNRVERESAACYADMENETFLIHRIAQKLGELLPH